MTLRMKRYKRLRYTGNSQQCLKHHNHGPGRKRRSWAGFPPWEQSVENPHRMKENLLWERKIAFLNVACKIPHLRVLQFLRTKSCPEGDWGIIKCWLLNIFISYCISPEWWICRFKIEFLFPQENDGAKFLMMSSIYRWALWWGESLLC